MEIENSSHLKVFGVSASHHPSAVWSDPAIRALTCSGPHLVDSKTPLSVLQWRKMNPLRDWKRSGLCCPRNHTRREWDLWDEVIEIQIEIHSAGTFSSNAYFLGDWFVWGRLRRFNSLAFPTAFPLFQVLNVPRVTIHGHLLSLVLRDTHHFHFCSFQMLLAVTLLLSTDSWEIILKWKQIYPPGRNWGHWYSGRGAVPPRLSGSHLSNLLIYRQAFSKGHSERAQTPRFAFVINNIYCMSVDLLCSKHRAMQILCIILPNPQDRSVTRNH